MAEINLKNRMSVEDILRQDVERTGGNFDAVYESLSKAINEGKTRILRHNNSLLVYNITKKGVAEVHMATVEKPAEIVEAIKSFVHAFKIAGFTLLHSEIDDLQIVRLIEMAKIPVQSHQTQGGYQITIEVK